MQIGEDQQEYEILPEEEQPVVVPEHEPKGNPRTRPRERRRARRV
jgi:hypothetical protein